MTTISWARVDELKSEVGADDFAELCEVFLSEVEDGLARLDFVAGMAALERDLHFLKGSALNIGLAEFAALCGAGETAAHANRLTPDDLGAIAKCYQASRAELIGAQLAD
ncbi:MAG: Hpt domain-containing protein [Deltaproteobacteria bacterium]